MPKTFTVLAVCAIHVLVAWAIVNGSNLRSQSERSEHLVMAFIRPTVAARTDKPPGPDLSTLSFRIPKALSSLDIDLPKIDFTVSRNDAAAVAGPSLDAYQQVDIGPYVRQAALLPGEGATVVLRIEVLENGLPGRIFIDVSSGSTLVDQAATDYARAHRWVAAVVGGTSHSMWIRWGVRLQA